MSDYHDVGEGWYCICNASHINECKVTQCIARDRISIECESAVMAAIKERARGRSGKGKLS